MSRCGYVSRPPVLSRIRILHIFDQCGVASELADYCRVLGISSQVFTTRANDKFAQTRGLVLPGPKSITFFGVLEALSSDVVVLHGNLSFVKYLWRVCGNLFLFAHGSEIRGNWESRREDLKYIKHVFVSTPDLLEGSPPGFATYVGRPISRIFSDPGGVSTRVPRALTFSYGADDEARDLARAYGLQVDVLGRSYLASEVPRLFSGYTHYVDVKRDHRGRSLIDPDLGVLSQTALEALASGLSVVTVRGVVAPGDPRIPPRDVEYAGRIFLEVISRFVGGV